MHGENVFLPIGFDAFGLPAENAGDQEQHQPARLDDVEHRQHAPPAPVDGRHVRLERRGRHRPTRATTSGTSGCSCGSSRPAWPTARSRPVDWCPNDGTLAREQVEGADRHCWRCGARVEKRDLDQWYLRVTKYADELLDFSGIEFPDPVRIQQTNWIGRSEGGEIVFRTAPSEHHAGGAGAAVFTTRPDTLFGRRSWSSPRSTRSSRS
jgi:leucyl-tRNA synthetase